MKRYFRYFLSLSFFFILIITLPTIVIAGDSTGTFTGPATPADGPTGDTDSIPAPIDGGITLLLAAGIGYGVKKHRENRKKKLYNLNKNLINI